MKQNKFTILTAALAVAGLVPSVSAGGAISQTLAFGGASPGTVTPFSDTLSFNKFNGTLGTLTGVTIELSSVTYGTVQVVNWSGNSEGFTSAYAQIPISVSAFSHNFVTTTAQATVASGTVPGPKYNEVDFAGTPGSDAQSVPITSGYWSQLTGSGTGTFDVSVASSLGNFSGSATPGHLLFGGIASAYGTVEIDYTYTPVPEPASMAMVAGLGLLGVGVYRRLRV
jgi:hypothetical protein